MTFFFYIVSSHLLLVPREGCASRLWPFLGVLLYMFCTKLYQILVGIPTDTKTLLLQICFCFVIKETLCCPFPM